MFFNTILIILIISIIILIGFLYYRNLKKNSSWEEEYVDNYNMDYLTRTVSEIFADILKQNLKEMNMSRKQLEQSEHLKTELRNALKEAAYGNKKSKRFVINYIRDLLLQHPKTKIPAENLNNVIHFDSPSSLKVREKFNIILYWYGKEHKENSLSQLIQDYNLKTPIYREDGSFYYDINEQRINDIYEDLLKNKHLALSDSDKYEIISERIFADYKGFGAVDCLFDTTVDEIDCGVSGIPKDSYDIKAQDLKDLEYSYNSIWIMVSGINIKLSCLGFGSQDELIRVCQNIYKFNAPATLSRSEGKVVSTMKDGSRIVVCRPPFCESWCFFARKFDSTPSITPARLLADENNVIPITLMKWFIKGYRTIAITGSQGTGKSTTLKSMIRFIPEDLNLRIQELAFELNLRYTYPKRNIVTFQETNGISAQEGLDLQKKTNGSVNIIGEVATAEAASWIIQTSMVASLYTLFTHHAKTARDLVIAIRNNLLETGGYNNEVAAEEMVSRVINIDFHMEKLKDRRFCSRITEIVPIRDRRYPSEINTEGKSARDLLPADTIEYQKRVTDREVFKTVNLMEWHDGRYVMTNMPSEEMMLDIRKNLLTDEEEQQFLSDMKLLRNYMEKDPYNLEKREIV